LLATVDVLDLMARMRADRLAVIASRDNAGSVSHAQGGVQALDELARSVEQGLLRNERVEEATTPLRDHLIGLSRGACIRCGESTHRIQSHPDLNCSDQKGSN